MTSAMAPRRAVVRVLPPFESLLQQHAETVLGFLVSRVGPVDAQDCFQETFLAALRAYPELRDASNLRGWLLTIAQHKVTDAARAARRRPLPTDAIEIGSVPPQEPADGDLWAAVNRLPAKQRRAVAMRFAGDRSYDDIAEAMSISADAARRNVHEGIKKLRRDTR
jgi:RNA polymerase sigma factor (sigma-70 family)